MITTFIRKYLMNAYSSIPMLVCLLFATWNSYGKRPANAMNFSGEEMFRGLFFIEGKYAEAIPELKSMGISYLYNEMNVVEKKEVIDLRNKVVGLITKENPAFFEHFKDVMLTENPILIKEELAKTHDIVNQKIQEVLDLSQTEFNSVQKTFSQSLKNNHNKVDKNLLKDFNKNAGTKSLEQQPCIILLMPICIVLFCWVVIYPVIVVEESIAGKKSTLLVEQMVASICGLSAQINA